MAPRWPQSSGSWFGPVRYSAGSYPVVYVRGVARCSLCGARPGAGLRSAPGQARGHLCKAPGWPLWWRQASPESVFIRFL